MARRRHPSGPVEEALRYAEGHGWRVEPGGPRAHAWGKMFCPHNDPECRCGEFCITSIWGTPRNPENHARQIRRVVDGCTGREACDDEE
ncbi:MAG TPA: hypothetical protein VL117_13935 [Thermoleophilia bacterium]|nr:hypothetical protein [Thermoleophilia bacterium]